MRTQIGIVGAGPAGLMLAHLLHLEGIESVVIESRSRDYVENRVRAGVLEQWVSDLLIEIGVGERMKREGLVHDGAEICFQRKRYRIDFKELTGRGIVVYGQQEVVKDLISARLEQKSALLFEAEGLKLSDLDSNRPAIHYTQNSTAQRVDCDFIAGCDGFHGIARPAISGLTEYDKIYPHAWLGILAEAPPASHELIYARHERGFALLSMRSPTVSRLYLQCAPDEDIAAWSDDRIWTELETRLAADGDWKLKPGPITQKGITPMRSFVAEPMQQGRLFLAGDAAHIVPPTGAKGMNLAIADVRFLARALAAFYKSGDKSLLDSYSATCLRRVWRAERFSAWMTNLLHKTEGANPFDEKIQFAELDYVVNSRAAMTALAENYVGLPF